jgi:hypothetical protein
MIQALREGAWDGVDEEITPEVIRAVYRHVDCISCKLAMSNRLVGKSGSGVQIYNIGEEISADVIGPIAPLDIQGHSSFFLFKDKA